MICPAHYSNCIPVGDNKMLRSYLSIGCAKAFKEWLEYHQVSCKHPLAIYVTEEHRRNTSWAVFEVHVHNDDMPVLKLLGLIKNIGIQDYDDNPDYREG